ncbi:MAG: TonB-dependent receptor [Bacteroidetes bacterium]|nr:TonB-dependent receptor [Bacteroidota bacterium]
MTVSPRLTTSHQKSNSVDEQNLRVQKTTFSYLSSTAVTNTNSVSDSWDAGGEVNLRHRFARKGETIRFRLAGQQHGQTSDKNFLSNTQTYDSAGNKLTNPQLDQQSHQTAPVTNIGASVGYTYPISKALVLDASYDLGSRRQKSDKATYNYNPVTKAYDLPDSLTTARFTTTLLTHRFGLGLNHSSKLFSYQAGLSAQYSDQQSRNFVGPGQDFSQYQLNWFPRAGFFYTIDKQNQLNLQYNGSTQGATIDQLQPLPDFSNPLLVKKGNPDLHPEFDHSASLGYQHFSKNRLQSVLLQVAFNMQQNKFTPATTILAGGVQQLQYVNTNGNYSGNFSASYNFPFAGGRKGNCKISSAFNYGHVISYTNGQENVQTSFGWDPHLSVNYSPLERLLLEGDAGLDFNHTDYSVGGRTLDQLNQRYELGVSYELPVGLIITSDLLSQITGPQGSLAGLSQNIWNASVSKRIFPKKTAEVRASVFDLLDSNKGFSQTVGENYISTSTNLVLRRTFYASFIYYFKKGLGR